MGYKQGQNMSLMFWAAHLFNQDISKWDTSNITRMSLMFKHAGAFNQDTSKWNTSKVRDAWLMFWGASAFKYAKQLDAKKKTKFYHLSH